MNILLHAPTENSYRRAKNNRLNILKDNPDTTVEVVVNAQAVHAAVEDKHMDNDIVSLCANSLRKAKLAAPVRARVIPNAMLHIARRQADGWVYIRA